MEDQSAVKIHEWEIGLTSFEDLMPLTQSLISTELALAFGISTEAVRPPTDLNRAAHDTYSTICHKEDNFVPLRLFRNPDCAKPKRVESIVGPNEGSKEEAGDDNGPGRAIKRPRLVWTPQLHKRFVDVIENLGIDKAVPKTIMEMMNVEGLTRENLASHLQKYRLYLKRVEGLSSESHSNPRQIPSLMDCDGFGPGPMSAQQPQPQPQQQQPPTLHCNPLSSMPMPMVGPPTGPYAFGHLGFAACGSASPGYCGLDSGAFNMFWNRQRG